MVEETLSDRTDVYTDDLTKEVKEAVTQVEQVVDEGSEAVDEAADVGQEVYDILMELSEGDRQGAVRAVLDIFSDETGREVREAIDAAKQVLAETEDVTEAFTDVFELVVQGARSVEDEANAVLDRLNQLF